MAEGRQTNLVNNLLRVNLRWPIQQGLRAPMTNPQRIRTDIRHFVQGLGPLMEHPGNFSSVMPQNITAWIRQHHENLRSGSQRNHQPFRSTVSTNDDASLQSVEDISIQVDGSHPDSPSHEPVSTNEAVNGSTSSNSQRNTDSASTTEIAASQDTNILRNHPELHGFLLAAEKYVPFFLILLVKLIFDHCVGILVVLGLFIAFCHANSIVKREVGKQAKRQVSNLLVVALNIATCIVFVYFVLAEDRLPYALVLIPPYTEPVTVWDVLWIISVTDFVLKLLIVAVKALIVALPGEVLAFQNKGKYYYFLETSSQLYRSIAPVRHWLYYFTTAYQDTSYIFGICLSVIYFVFKCQELLRRIRDCHKGIRKLLQSVSYGSKPTKEQLEGVGGICPICQDDFRVPTLLHCKHIFCEECVSVWFDREKTCPMCRAEIADDPTWRDGSTSLLIQIF